MRILLTCDPEIPVPPKEYGGIERIVDALVSSYFKEGHEVFLVANPSSDSSKAKKIFGWPVQKSRGYNSIIRNGVFLSKVVNTIRPDIIHSFSRLMYLYPILLTSKVPIVQSYQRGINNQSTSVISLFAKKRIVFTACADHMIRNLRVRSKCSVIYNFTNINYFIPDPNQKREHLLFLGRIEDIKGTRECIEVAIATNTKLIIAGNIQPGHDEYFNNYIKPHLNNPLVEYVGPVDDQQKLFYMQRAKAFLFPIKWEEPFGIVMAEALACGVPVIGFRRGSVPEVVKEGKNGFIVNDVEGMIGAVKKISQINTLDVRKDCEFRFSQESISYQYISLLKSRIEKCKS